MSEIKEELKRMLGEDAFNTGTMQVSDRVAKLVKSVNYLVGQLNITANMVEDESNRDYVKEHVEKVITATKGILSKEESNN